MLEKCHHFTLTDSFVIVQNINFSCQVQVLRRNLNGRGRHFQHKNWFLISNHVQPTLFLKKLSFIKVKGELVTETNADSDFTTMIPIVIILCFIEHLYCPQAPAEMCSNVFILMECYLK